MLYKQSNLPLDLLPQEIKKIVSKSQYNLLGVQITKDNDTYFLKSKVNHNTIVLSREREDISEKLIYTARLSYTRTIPILRRKKTIRVRDEQWVKKQNLEAVVNLFK